MNFPSGDISLTTPIHTDCRELVGYNARAIYGRWVMNNVSWLYTP
ncbi:MAG: hypothetical protein RMX68_007475 [Aulosira sp. ZfuVER01]|nr:hypothetical protein [Aulosira sp. DedVER01a]MDZ8054752.1 hypothetical protein [Aulosira sp. ZfuCHP01]